MPVISGTRRSPSLISCSCLSRYFSPWPPSLGTAGNRLSLPVWPWQATQTATLPSPAAAEPCARAPPESPAASSTPNRYFLIVTMLNLSAVLSKEADRHVTTRGGHGSGACYNAPDLKPADYTSWNRQSPSCPLWLSL